MSNRSLGEVRRRGDAPVDLRDFQRRIAAPAPPPKSAPAPADTRPFRPAVPRPISPYEQTRQPSRQRLPIPTLRSPAGRIAYWLARRVPAIMVGGVVVDYYAARIRARRATTVPVLNDGIYDYPGKVLQWTCARLAGYGDPQYMSYGHSPPACIAGQAIFNGGTAPGDTLIAWPGSSTVSQWETHLVNGLAHNLAWWTTQPFQNGPYPAGLKYPVSATPLPAKIPQFISPSEWNAPAPTPMPLPWPALAPETIPIGAPAPVPLPIPFWMIPFRVPSGMPEASTRGYSIPQEKWLDLTAASYKIDARTAAKPGPLPRTQPSHRFRPPGVRTKERKAKITDAARRTLKLVNEFTEAGDVVDIFYDALPEELKKDGPFKGLHRSLRPQEKLQQLYRHWDKVKLKDAIKNWIENEAEDRVFGAIGKRIGKLSRQSGRPVGYESGGSLGGKLPKGFDPGPSPWKDWMDIVWP